MKRDLIELCPLCNGFGWVRERITLNTWSNEPCSNCRGSGRLLVTKTVKPYNQGDYSA